MGGVLSEPISLFQNDDVTITFTVTSSGADLNSADFARLNPKLRFTFAEFVKQINLTQRTLTSSDAPQHLTFVFPRDYVFETVHIELIVEQDGDSKTAVSQSPTKQALVNEEPSTISFESSLLSVSLTASFSPFPFNVLPSKENEDDGYLLLQAIDLKHSDQARPVSKLSLFVETEEIVAIRPRDTEGLNEPLNSSGCVIPLSSTVVNKPVLIHVFDKVKDEKSTFIGSSQVNAKEQVGSPHKLLERTLSLTADTPPQGFLPASSPTPTLSMFSYFFPTSALSSFLWLKTAAFFSAQNPQAPPVPEQAPAGLSEEDDWKMSAGTRLLISDAFGLVMAGYNMDLSAKIVRWIAEREMKKRADPASIQTPPQFPLVLEAIQFLHSLGPLLASTQRCPFTYADISAFSDAAKMIQVSRLFLVSPLPYFAPLDGKITPNPLRDQRSAAASLILSRSHIPTVSTFRVDRPRASLFPPPPFYAADRTGKKEQESVPADVMLYLRMHFAMDGMAGRISPTIHTNGMKWITQLLTIASFATGQQSSSPASAAQIPGFIAQYSLKTPDDPERDYEVPEGGFSSLNAFFTRKLKPGARTIEGDDSVVVSPSDGRLVSYSSVSEATTLWIKGTGFSVRSCLQNDELFNSVKDGSIIIARLMPRDYHRVHCPVNSVTIKKVTTLPGTYLSVSPALVCSRDCDIFGGNHRVVLHCTSPLTGDFAVVFVAAAMVGACIVTVKEGQTLQKGEEMGYFEFGGSSVLIAFASGVFTGDEEVAKNSQASVETSVKMGEKIGTLVH
ncbi:Phosphatidylserine decarboxylase [Blattamonas nauphoetae]|uniref:Phosphatidylserine decarboxylase n=1 Tax=Blattamonas nauphoetae TaxID=2049346 RepID=A0ABQ9YFL4_9EUKA|nr:Phosphatidylserine decarboxylase [Blattamonas nauphoetae]